MISKSCVGASISLLQRNQPRSISEKLADNAEGSVEHNMKKITCLVLAVILLSFIIENSEGKITILHEGRVSGKPKRKSRRQTARKTPSTPANEDNGNSAQDRRRPVVCNHTINVFLLLFQRWPRYLLSAKRPHEKKKKMICVFLSQKYNRWHESPHWI